MVIAAIYLPLGLGWRPRPGAVPRVWVWGIGYVALAGLVDWLAGANYAFLREPAAGSLMEVLGAVALVHRLDDRPRAGAVRLPLAAVLEAEAPPPRLTTTRPSRCSICLFSEREPSPGVSRGHMMRRSDLGEAGLHARDYWRVVRNRWPLVIGCFLLLYVTAMAVTYLTPPKYLGRTLVEISHPGRVEDPAGMVGSARFIENQFKIISSKEVLGRVVDELGLVDRWDTGTDLAAFRQLSAVVETEVERGTDMVAIEVLLPDAGEAAEVANAVTAAYETRRRDMFKTRRAEVEATLAAKEAEQEEKLAAAHTEFIAVAEKLGIANIDPDFLTRFGEADDTGGLQGMLERMQAEVFAAQTALHQAESKVRAVEGLEGDQLIRMADTMGLADAALAARYESYKGMQLEQIELKRTGLGPGHPRWIALDEKLEATRGFLLEAADELKAGLAQNLEIARLSHERFEQAYAQLEQRSQGARKTNDEFVSAARDYQVQLSTLRDLKVKLEQQRIDGAFDPVIVQVHEHAEADDRPATPNTRLNLAVGALLGLFFGVGMAFFLEYLDNSVRGVDEVEDKLGAPVLAVVPTEVAPLHETGVTHPDAEAYRILRTNIEFALADAGGNVITFVSGGAGEGKSTTLMNFATVCAAGGQTVLVIDADLRRPRLHSLFGIRNSTGLTNYLADGGELEDMVLRTPQDNLFFIPSGVLPADAAGALSSPRFRELLDDARGRFDIVLVDSPPILGVSDGALLASEADSTVVVVQHGKLPRPMLEKIRVAADKVGANLLGAVLNNVDLRSDPEYQYYTSYYTYYADSPRDAAVAPAKGERGKAGAAAEKEVAW